MPLGAFRLNSLAKFQPSAAGFVSFEQLNGDAIFSATYQQLAYCGENSSGEPVFCACYATTNRLNQYAQMFSVDLTTGAITIGTKYTIATTTSPNLLIGPSVASERDHANIRQDLSANDYLYFAWRLSPTNRVRALAASYDVDALTMSLGSEETFSDTFTAVGDVKISYTGGNLMIMSRGSTNSNYVLMAGLERTSGTSLALSTTINAAVNLGGWGGGINLGFKNERATVTAVGNNSDRVQFAAYRDNSGVLVNYTQQLQEQNETNTNNISVQANATDSLINLRFETQVAPTNTQFEGVIVDWQTGATAPSITRTNQIEWNSIAVGRLGAVNGAVDGETYFWRQNVEDADDNIRCCKVSLSGSTISKGSDFLITVPASTRMGEAQNPSARLVTVTSGEVVWVTFFENTLNSARGDIMVVINPDLL